MTPHGDAALGRGGGALCAPLCGRHALPCAAFPETGRGVFREKKLDSSNIINQKKLLTKYVKKTTKDYERESRNRRQRLQELIARNKEVDRLFERIYEDNVAGKLTDNRFMKMSQRYDEEQ